MSRALAETGRVRQVIPGAPRKHSGFVSVARRNQLFLENTAHGISAYARLRHDKRGSTDKESGRTEKVLRFFRVIRGFKAFVRFRKPVPADCAEAVKKQLSAMGAETSAK